MGYAVGMATTPHIDGVPLRGRVAVFSDQRVSTPDEDKRQRWHGVIGIEGERTGDGRFIAKNGLYWDELPIPLRHASADFGGHDGAVTVGTIEEITRSQNGLVEAWGYFDEGGPNGIEAARVVEAKLENGVSMDLDSVDVTIDIDTDTQDINSARVRAATIVSIPAFATAKIFMSSADDPEDADPALVAGAAPETPPASWFENPKFSEVTPFTVTADGRVYGHLATFNQCHIGFADQCVAAPQSKADYRYFRTGAVLTDKGMVATGAITLSTLHADKKLSANDTAAHYEHTGAAVADVAAGEDEFGIWVAGAARPGITPDQVRELRASPLSGDWRRIAGNLELVAALAVNVPGFPVARPSQLVASGETQALVAAGVVSRERAALANSNRERAHALRRKVERSKLAMRIGRR